MADEETTTTEDRAATATVPKDRLDKEIEKRRQLEQENADFRKRLEALEDNGKSDVERLTKELERERSLRAEQDKALAERDAKIERAEKSNMIRAAAEKAGLVDPDAAVAFANLDEINDPSDAKRHIDRIAKDKPYLVKQEQQGPNLERVFGPGGQNGEQAQRFEDLSEDQVKRIQGEQIMAEVNKARALAGLEPITPGGAE